MTVDRPLSAEEIALVSDHRERRQRNPDYVLWDFDDNLRRVIDEGFDVLDRTGVGCRVLTGITSKIEISDRIPVPTRRATAWRAMLKEYLWFISGSHSIDDLTATGSKVWEPWRDDEFCRANGFPDGSIGYGYGFNLLHFGGEIADQAQQPGFNQLDYVINTLRNDPASRRILFIFYRPDRADAANVKLPACHVAYQFVPRPNADGALTILDCCVYQRSSDAFVGNLSTNLQGAAFLTWMIAQQVGMTAGTLSHFSANFHVYHNHLSLVDEYLTRSAPNSPRLTLAPRDSIYDYRAEDFELDDYSPLAKQQVPVAV
ncbi:thymidylate synthase [Gammaproteobacteria bacterium]|nr:thymidylate synthase [Gammaproteobacteria bacterium]